MFIKNGDPSPIEIITSVDIDMSEVVKATKKAKEETIDSEAVSEDKDKNV